MHGIAILTIIFGSIILCLAIIGSTILMAIKILKGGVSRKEQGIQAEEAKKIQEMYQGLSRMEERVDVLETIILDHERKERAL
jgi:phage shock protein B